MSLSAMRSFKPRTFGSFEEARTQLGEVRGFVVWGVKQYLPQREGVMGFTVGPMTVERCWQEPHADEELPTSGPLYGLNKVPGHWEECLALPQSAFEDDKLHEDILGFLRSEKGEVDYLDDGESTRYTWAA